MKSFKSKAFAEYNNKLKQYFDFPEQMNHLFTILRKGILFLKQHIPTR